MAEAVERGLKRREQEGKDIETMGPVCTIMVGRLDDWLKVVADKQDISVDPGVLEWAGVAVFKKTYRLFQERGYRIRLLSAAFRNHMHWSELDRRRRRDLAAARLAEALQQAGDVGVEPRIDTPSRRQSSPPREVRRLIAGPRRSRDCRAKNSTPSRRRAARCGSSSPPATSSTRRSGSSCFRILMAPDGVDPILTPDGCRLAG